MNEALLSGSLDVVSAGVPPALTVWDRTKGRQNVKMVAALGSLSNYLITNKPGIRSLKDFGPGDRIAVPAAGVGFQSRVLQIETAREFGPENFRKFDDISVSLPHPDATAVLIAGGTEIDAHFSSAPFYYQALAGNKAVHKILNSYDTLGGPATFNVLYATEKFHDEHAKAYKAFYAALGEAAGWIKAHKAEAAEVFIRQQESKLAPSLVAEILNDPENDFTIAPQKTGNHGEVGGDAVRGRYGEARHTIDALGRLGVDIEHVAEVLEAQGLASFGQSWDELIASVTKRIEESGAEGMPAGAVTPASGGASSKAAPAAGAPRGTSTDAQA